MQKLKLDVLCYTDMQVLSLCTCNGLVIACLASSSFVQCAALRCAVLGWAVLCFAGFLALSRQTCQRIVRPTPAHAITHGFACLMSCTLFLHVNCCCFICHVVAHLQLAVLAYVPCRAMLLIPFLLLRLPACCPLFD